MFIPIKDLPNIPPLLRNVPHLMFIHTCADLYWIGSKAFKDRFLAPIHTFTGHVCAWQGPVCSMQLLGKCFLSLAPRAVQLSCARVRAFLTERVPSRFFFMLLDEVKARDRYGFWIFMHCVALRPMIDDRSMAIGFISSDTVQIRAARIPLDHSTERWWKQ